MLKCVFVWGTVKKRKCLTQEQTRDLSPVAEGSNHNAQALIMNIKTGIWKEHIWTTYAHLFLWSKGSALPATIAINQTRWQSLACTTRHPTAFSRYSPALCFSSAPQQGFQQPHLALPHTSAFKRHKGNINPTLTSSSLVMPTWLSHPLCIPE